MTPQFYRVVTPNLLTCPTFHAMIPIVSGNVDGQFKGVEPGESVQTQQQVTRLSFALMTFPTGNRGFHKAIGGKLNCFISKAGLGSAEHTTKPLPAQ